MKAARERSDEHAALSGTAESSPVLALLCRVRAEMSRDDAAVLPRRLAPSPELHAAALAAAYRELPLHWRVLVGQGESPEHMHAALDRYLHRQEPGTAEVLFDCAIEKAG